MKIVCDTNISISGFLWGGRPNQIIKLARAKKIELCGVFEMLKEFEKVLKYPRLQKRIQTLQTTPAEIVVCYEEILTIYEMILLPEVIVTEDPDDDIFISAALSSGAKLIVSRDKHLLKVLNYRNIQIVNDEEFLKIYKKIRAQ